MFLFSIKAYYDMNNYAPPNAYKSFELRHLYKHVRHPSFSGFCIVLWFTNLMTLDRLLLSSLLTIYMYVAWSTDRSDLIYQKCQLKRKMQEMKSQWMQRIVYGIWIKAAMLTASQSYYKLKWKQEYFVKMQLVFIFLKILQFYVVNSIFKLFHNLHIILHKLIWLCMVLMSMFPTNSLEIANNHNL